MRKSLKQLLLILLALLSAVICACGQNVSDNTAADNVASPVTSNPSENTETQTKTQTNPRANIADSLPDDLDFNGETVTILHRGGDDATVLEIFAEDNAADVVSNAVYNRNLRVEERLNVIIVSVPTLDTVHDGGYTLNSVREAVQAASEDFDVVANHMSQSTPMILEGLLRNLQNQKYFDWNQPWWNRSFIEQITLSDKLYFAVGDFSQTMIRGNYVMFFNKDLFADTFHDEDIYSLVMEGGWTMDKMKEYCEIVHRDVNGNTTNDPEDTFGFVFDSIPGSSMHDAFVGACNVEMIRSSADGDPEIVINNEHTYDFIDSMKDLLYKHDYTWLTLDFTDSFINGSVLFMADRLDATETFRDMASDYGIIPMPKLNESQEKYTGFTHNGFSVFALPVTCQKTDLSCAFLEAMTAESYRNVTYAYFEVALKSKYARDDISAQMLDMITENVRFEFGFVYSASLNNILQIFRSINGDELSSAPSVIKSMETSSKTSLKSFLKKFEKLEN